jgi:hypothetical protein
MAVLAVDFAENLAFNMALLVILNGFPTRVVPTGHCIFR